MTTLGNRARQVDERYRAGHRQPLSGYVAVLSVYGAVVGAASLVARLTGRRPPERLSLGDIAVTGIATHKLSRLLSKDAVTSPLRAPFTRYQEATGESEVMEDVRGEGVQHAVGELVTCPFCAGVWVATAFGLGAVFAPRLTRLVAGTGAAIAAADFLQLGYDAAKQSLQRFSQD